MWCRAMVPVMTDFSCTCSSAGSGYCTIRKTAVNTASAAAKTFQQRR